MHEFFGSHSVDSRSGYLHPAYVASLSEFGAPRSLPRCGGWILVRRIPGYPYHDAIGCYPLFTCQDWSALHADLEDIGTDLVSLALVPDPFGEFDITLLKRCFDIAKPFKQHFVVKLDQPLNAIVSRHHRKYARRSLQSVKVEVIPKPMSFLNDWVLLYSNVVERHNLRGIKAFSETAFATQLSIPGLVVFRALSGGTVIGAHLWYVQGDIAYGHLGAVSPTGYELLASYALFWSGLEYFTGRVRWLDLGGGSGVSEDESDGLRLFKRGWSTGTRQAYFCGRVFDHEKYAELVEAKGTTGTPYFPAYRMGELG